MGIIRTATTRRIRITARAFTMGPARTGIADTEFIIPGLIGTIGITTAAGKLDAERFFDEATLLACVRC
jgi:hypothetical protein